MFETISHEKVDTLNYIVYRTCKHDRRIMLLAYENKRPEALFYYTINMLC